MSKSREKQMTFDKDGLGRGFKTVCLFELKALWWWIGVYLYIYFEGSIPSANKLVFLAEKLTSKDIRSMYVINCSEAPALDPTMHRGPKRTLNINHVNLNLLNLPPGDEFYSLPFKLQAFF